MKRRTLPWGLKLGVGFGVSAVLLWLALRQVDFGSLGGVLLQVNYWFVAVGILVYFVDVGLRTLRWRVLLQATKVIPFWRLYSVLTIGYMANNLLPGRIGELSRAYLVGRREGISASTVLASVAIERLIDGVTVLALLVVTLAGLPLSTSPGGGWLVALTRVAAITFGIGLALSAILIASPGTWLRLARRILGILPLSLSERLVALLDHFIDGFAVLRDPRQLVATLGLSVLIWLVGATTYILVAFAFGVRLPLIGAVAAICVVNLATAVPQAPAGLGAFEAAAVQAFVLLGVGGTLAVAITLVLHAVLFLPVVVAGLAFLWRLNLDLGSLWTGSRAATAEVLEPLP